MKEIIDGLSISYNQYGKGKDIVMLHGWGQNKEMMDFLGILLKDKYRITTVDLPGFGKSDEPKKVLTLDDYAEIINKLVNRLKIKNFSLIGHSFGGKVSIIYANKYEVDKLILLASPIFKAKEDKSLKLKVLKFFAKFKFLEKLKEKAKKYLGSVDYKNATPIMRDILVEHVNRSVDQELLEIKAPTLLVWGNRDDQVDISEAREVEKKMHDAALIEFKGGSHYAYLENKYQLASIIKNFI